MGPKIWGANPMGLLLRAEFWAAEGSQKEIITETVYLFSCGAAGGAAEMRYNSEGTVC